MRHFAMDNYRSLSAGSVISSPLLTTMSLRWFFCAVMKDTVLLGQHVPKGTRLIFPNNTGMEEAPGWHAGRADEVERKVGLWQPGSAEEYRPERWLREDGSFDPNAGPMTPFGSGIRGCFGKNLAVSTSRTVRCFWAED